MPENNKITKNSFSKGRNTDVNVSDLSPDQYISAHNVEFIANGNFFALQNLQGTTNLKQIGSDSTLREIGSAPCKFSIDGVLTYCIVYFTMSSLTGTYNIWMYDTEHANLYALYQETYGAGYYTDDRVVDIVNYPENGIDHIYFTDGYNELRHITCSITTPWVANSLSAYDIALQQRGANGIIALTGVTNGGSLLSGTYQFAYRMANPTTKKFTKWSYITNPVHVYSGDNVTAQVFAGIGLQTTRQILLEVHPSPDEIASVVSSTLPFIQLAVIENIGSTPAITVSLQPYVRYLPSGASSMAMTYQSNTRIASQSLDSFVIDPAQILAAKTLRTTNNRLFLGNIDYVNLKFDSPLGSPKGVPAVQSGTIIPQQSAAVGQGDSYTSDTFSSDYIGYFRDEVYRFGVVYKDKYGNRSYVSTLNMNVVTDNQSNQTGGIRDMKFPKRSTDKKYTLFNSNGAMQGLGLQLTIVNHPTWAVEMEVVRVPRIKNILFQTPLIPMMSVNGTGALGEYPSLFSIYNQGQTAYPNAQPMTADKVFVPKNMFWPEGRDIIYTPNVGDFPSLNFQRNEVIMDNGNQSCPYNFSMVFPQANMYGDTLPGANGLTNGFVYTGSEKIDFVDQALLKVHFNNQLNNPAFATTQTPYVLGENVDTTTSGNFFAVEDKYYLFDSTFTTGKPFPNAANYNGTPVTGYQFYDNLGVTAPVSGQSVMDYHGLATKGFTYGYEPTVQRSGVVSLGFTVNVKDPTFTGATFKAGVLNPYSSGGGPIFGGGGPHYEGKNTLTCTYLSDPGTVYAVNNAVDPVTAVDIVNVKLGLEDNRYGDINALHTFQSTAGISPTPVASDQSNTTGIHTFTTSEQSQLQAGLQVVVTLQVWGGDCFVSPHTFKISDGAYSITNSRKAQLILNGTNSQQTETQKWGGFYFNGSGTGSQVHDNQRICCLPIGVKNAAQFITVVLESEYNGGVRDHEIITFATSANGVPILNSQTIATCRTPLSYRYNFNLSRGNYQKVFTTQLQNSFQQFSYDSRVAWSNIKIYNSDISGFDTFNVSDFFDLPEQRYGITSLAVAADMLYALQERGVVYLPTSGRQIEQADSSTLAVVSDVVIGRPVVVSTERGTQHLRSVNEIGDMIFMTDNKNKEFYVLAGTELQLISINQQTELKRIWSSQFPGNAVKGVYDFVNEQWLIVMPSGIQVFDHARKLWVGDYEGYQGLAFGGTYQKGVVYLTAFDGVTSNLCIYSLYTGAFNSLFGNTVDPRVTFAVNPDEAFSKTFDVMMIDSSDKLDKADLQVVYDTSSAPSNINGLNLAVPNIENNYRIPLGKDQNGYRLRGMRMLVTAHWSALQAQLKSIFTKYRYSKRIPF